MSGQVIKLEKPVKDFDEFRERCRERGGGEEAGRFLESLHGLDDADATKWWPLEAMVEEKFDFEQMKAVSIPPKFLPRLLRRGLIELNVEKTLVRLTDKGRVKGKWRILTRCPHCGSPMLRSDVGDTGPAA